MADAERTARRGSHPRPWCNPRADGQDEQPAGDYRGASRRTMSKSWKWGRRFRLPTAGNCSLRNGASQAPSDRWESSLAITEFEGGRAFVGELAGESACPTVSVLASR